jgi:RecB family exonuclease
MTMITKDLPIPYNSTMEIMDSSKIKEFLTCPRKFFYSYMLGLRSLSTNQHFVFGSALHLALEHLYKNRLNPDELPAAMKIFMDEYRTEISEEEEHQYAPKTPEFAYLALDGYLKVYSNSDIATYDVVATEVPIEIEIHPEMPTKLTGVLDLVLRSKRDGKIWFLDHKTGQRNSMQWEVSYMQSVQMLNYLAGGLQLYGEDQVGGMIVNGIFLTKTGTGDPVKGYRRVWIKYDKRGMLAHLTNMNYIIDQYRNHVEILSKEKKDNPYMISFPRNPESCTHYGICPLFDTCRTVHNPISFGTGEVVGFKREFWNPLEKGK